MKKKIITAIIFSAILLTACNRETPIVDDLEPSGTTSAPQTVQVVQSVTKSENSEEDTSFVLGGNTETTAEISEATTETTTETEAVPEPALDVQQIDISGILEKGESFSNASGIFSVGDIAAVSCYDGNREAIRFFDINDLSVKANVTAPDGWELDGGYYHCIEGGGDVLCKVPLSYYDSEKQKDNFAAIIVHKDFTTEFTEGEAREIFSFPAGSHNISDYPYDISDADSGAVLVEGFQDTSTEMGFDSKWFYYNFAIDDDRFVYRVSAYESMPGFGYYDYNSGTAVEFPESKNFLPVGYHDGKIYAEQTAWASMCFGEMYTFDLETLESEHFITFPEELGKNSYTEYYMPPNGEYIIASVHIDDNENYENSQNIVYIISPDSGEVLAQREFGSEYGDLRSFAFIDDYTFAAYNYNTKEVVVFDVTI